MTTGTQPQNNLISSDLVSLLLIHFHLSLFSSWRVGFPSPSSERSGVFGIRITLKEVARHLIAGWSSALDYCLQLVSFH